MRAVFVESGERRVLAGAPLAGFGFDRFKPGEPICDVVLKACLRLFAVADDIDSERELLVHDLRHRLRGFAREGIRIERPPGHARQQQVGQRMPAWETAHTCRDNAAAALGDDTHFSSLNLLLETAVSRGG